MTFKGQVLLTGGAGFLGRGIMRQADRESWPCEFTVYSRSEQQQFQCRSRFPSARYVLGDVRDTERLSLIMTGHDIVVHAGALKFVAESESNVSECIDINIGGTSSVIRACRASGVPQVVLISTDKAVEPANVYGMTKALAERMFAEASRVPGDTKFVTVRYGNVIGSTGSLIPAFMQQLAQLGHVNVTSLEATRYWLTVDQAVDLIELALTQVSGSMVIPHARAMALREIVQYVAEEKFQVHGLRPGEKLHEKLLTTAESLRALGDTLCYDDEYVVYHPDRKIAQGPGYELTSDLAETLAISEFIEAANDSLRLQ